MSQNSYDYANRTGILAISWIDFHGLCKGLAQAIAPFRPEMTLPIGRGGTYPGALIAHLLQVEVYPIRLSRRESDVVTRPTPAWLVEPPAAVRGCRVLIVDEISSSGETLRLARERVEALPPPILLRGYTKRLTISQKESIVQILHSLNKVS